MAPLALPASSRALIAKGILSTAPDIALISARHVLSPRSLTVNKAQAVTLGVIAVYVVAIALLWNIPIVRWSLWPFKVSGACVPGVRQRLAPPCPGRYHLHLSRRTEQAS
jgi:hypothetical protein